MQLTAHICGASRYEFEDQGQVRKGASLILLSDVNADDENRVGMQFSEATAEFEVIDQLRDLGLTYPCNVDCEIDMRTVKAGNGKTRPTMHITAVRLPPGAAGRHQQAKADQAKANA